MAIVHCALRHLVAVLLVWAPNVSSHHYKAHQVGLFINVPGLLPPLPLLCCRDVTVLVLDRPRHAQLIKEIRAAGARIRMISDGDVSCMTNMTCMFLQSSAYDGAWIAVGSNGTLW